MPKMMTLKILCFGKCPLNIYHDCNKHQKLAVKAVATIMTDSLVSDCFVNTIMLLIATRGEFVCSEGNSQSRTMQFHI